MSLPPEAKGNLAPWFTPQELDAFRYKERGPICWAFRALFHQDAVTWNRVVHFAQSQYDPRTPEGLSLIAHEMLHVRQQRELGWLRFLARYVWALRRAQYRGSRNAQHPMERPAYALGQEVLEALQRQTG